MNILSFTTTQQRVTQFPLRIFSQIVTHETSHKYYVFSTRLVSPSQLDAMIQCLQMTIVGSQNKQAFAVYDIALKGF